MTPYERFFNMLEGKEVDRVPNLNIFMFFAAKYINQPFGKFCTDYRVLVEGNIKSSEAFGVDFMSTMSDPVRETADFGTKLIIPEDEIPHPESVLLPEIEDVKKLQLFDPYSSVRILDRIKAIELFKKEMGNHYPILGWVEGPIAEASDLRGINNSLMDIVDEDSEELFTLLLEKCTQQAILCAKAQVESGAHVIGMGDAAASLISRELYQEKVLPYEKRIVDAIHEAGGKVKLHICGDITHILEDIVTLGVDVIDIDWMVDMERTLQLFDGVSIVNGNIDPVAVMLNGTVDEVKAAVRNCMQISKGKACISAGCEIPKYTPYENLTVFTETLYEKI